MNQFTRPLLLLVIAIILALAACGGAVDDAASSPPDVSEAGAPSDDTADCPSPVPPPLPTNKYCAYWQPHNCAVYTPAVSPADINTVVCPGLDWSQVIGVACGPDCV